MLHAMRSWARVLYALAVVAALSFGATKVFGSPEQGPCDYDPPVLGSCAEIDCAHECLVVHGGVAWECEQSDNCCMCASR